MLAAAGLVETTVQQIEEDPMNYCYLSRKR
jgi:hypothetical protein